MKPSDAQRSASAGPTEISCELLALAVNCVGHPFDSVSDALTPGTQLPSRMFDAWVMTLVQRRRANTHPVERQLFVAAQAACKARCMHGPGPASPHQDCCAQSSFCDSKGINYASEMDNQVVADGGRGRPGRGMLDVDVGFERRSKHKFDRSPAKLIEPVDVVRGPIRTIANAGHTKF
jgi:hypothetical protein